MKTLVISKPIYEYILPLVEFPQDGDNFYINESIKTISSAGTLIAITLAKYGIDVSFTGMIGEDEKGRIIKEVLESYKIDTKYVETSYTEKTSTNFKIYNSKTNKFTIINEKSIKNTLTKYKYEFIPDVIIMDDGDYGANLAAINNYPNSKLIYVGDKFTKDSQVYCNKCNCVIATLSFASDATGVSANLNKSKNVVQLFQKYIDIYNSNLIIRLNNFDFLYCVNDEVRLIKNVNKNITNKQSLYNSLLVYFLINTNEVENSIKLTNKVMLETSSELDMIKNIPDYKDIKLILDSLENNFSKEPISEVQSGIQNEINSNNKEFNDEVLDSNISDNNLNGTQVLNENKIDSLDVDIETPQLNVINQEQTNINGVNEIEKL